MKLYQHQYLYHDFFVDSKTGFMIGKIYWHRPSTPRIPTIYYYHNMINIMKDTTKRNCIYNKYWL